MRGRIFATLLGSVLLTLSFPCAIYTPNLVPPIVSALVIWFAYVPVALAVRDLSPGSAFRWGYLFGFLANTGIFFWIIIAMRKYGGLSILTSSSILLSLLVVLALYPAVTFWAMAKFKRTAPRWLVGALLGTLLEWTRVYMPIEGFPWGTPAYALSGALPLIQVADLGGVAGINLWILLTNFALVEMVHAWRTKTHLPRVALGTAGALLLFSLVYGFLRPAQVRSSLGPEKLRVALLQPDIRQDAKWDSRYKMEILVRLRDMTARAAQADPDLIVWPEASLPRSVSADTEAFPFLAGAPGRAEVVLGSATRRIENERSISRNSAFVVAPDGTVRLRYDKMHLVPFGEYVPLSSVLPMYKIVPAVAGDFSTGDLPAALPTVRDFPFGILICYEVLFPDLAAAWTRNGARFLVNITNDAWFDQTSGPFQHANFGIFRAVETRRPIVRAANTGVSAWYEPTGERRDETGLFEERTIVAEIPLPTIRTFYVRHPQAVPHLAAFLLLLASLGVFRRRVQKDA